MKQKTHLIAFPVTFVVILAFLSIISFADTRFSFAASGGNDKPAGDKFTAVKHTELQIKKLQSTLNITDAQKELWNTLTQVMRENAKDMDALTVERAEHTKTMNSVELMKFHSQIIEAHLNQLKKFIPPFEAFYASMSDQQKNITDMIFRTGEYRKHHKK